MKKGITITLSSFALLTLSACGGGGSGGGVEEIPPTQFNSLSNGAFIIAADEDPVDVNIDGLVADADESEAGFDKQVAEGSFAN